MRIVSLLNWSPQIYADGFGWWNEWFEIKFPVVVEPFDEYGVWFVYVPTKVRPDTLFDLDWFQYEFID